MWRPLRLANVFLRQRAREWTVTGFLMISPSLTNFRICWPVVQTKYNKDAAHWCLKKTWIESRRSLREFALAISLVSFGSSQTFFLPQLKTLDAKRFWSLSMLGKKLRFYFINCDNRFRALLQYMKIFGQLTITNFVGQNCLKTWESISWYQLIVYYLY